MLDENEFLSPYGIRSLSRFTRASVSFHVGEPEYGVALSAGESDSGCSAATRTGAARSGCRQRAHHPRAAAILRLLTATTSPSSARPAPAADDLYQVAEEISRGSAAFSSRTPTASGGEWRRAKFQEDPHWRDCIQFYEYFHGDNGRGLEPATRPAWTGVIASVTHFFATVTAEGHS
jgi:hypothetical protein